ncbi:EAL domain [Vibrio sp. B1ASS3]|uniref:EAL domain-containing response regulator n=1 Tax=Vibrio sp. B1ASS3 TaxID=2751176 RepID=UPI001ABB4280|nr:response regulator [Vibrio sp. B1ASS3]CAD7809750.1 EAL domain [Vibrio sp. B1ASS3]CAE6910315.1 EAL domain [Vibrio sp. B1ASS3]
MHKSVLIVDDVELSREILKNAVLRANAEVKTVAVENAYAAINKMRTKKFDLVIMDIMMPNGDGFELLNMISQLSLSTKIVVISSLDKAVIDVMWKIGKLYEVDIVTALEKPINSKQLTELVAQELEVLETREERKHELACNSNIFQFPIGVYYQTQVNTETNEIFGIEVGGNWFNDLNSPLLSNHLLPDVARLKDKKLYNQIVIGKFLHEYREYLCKLPRELSFTFHVEAEHLADSVLMSCLIELNQISDNHEFCLHLNEIEQLDKMSDIALEHLKQLLNSGFALSIGARDLTEEIIERAKSNKIKQLKLISDVTRQLDFEKKDNLFIGLSASAALAGIALLCDGIENTALSEALKSIGLSKQQGILFSGPLAVNELMNSLGEYRSPRALEKEA